MNNRKQRLTKAERNSIRTARRSVKRHGTKETEKYLVSIKHHTEDGVAMKAGDWK